MSFIFTCPGCRAQLTIDGERAECPGCRAHYERQGGIWQFLHVERTHALERFIEEYTTVRHAEGRGGTGPAFYRALPFEDKSGRFREDWRIRAASFQALLEQVVVPYEQQRRHPLRVLDLGAGNGWLSYRLALRGHSVAAVDLLAEAQDGLGAYIHYDAAFIPVQAEFDRLPFDDNQFDIIIFNASFHYAVEYCATLAEALRVLGMGGRLVIMDSPVYRSAASGAQMVREREDYFLQTYGFRSDAMPSEHYLTYARLEELATALKLRWHMIRPFYGLKWALRPLRARLRGRREPAAFLLIVGEQCSV